MTYDEGKYYWARHIDNSWFIVKREAGNWYTVGMYYPMEGFEPEKQIICQVKEPLN